MTAGRPYDWFADDDLTDARGIERPTVLLNGIEHQALASCNPGEVVGWHVDAVTLRRLMLQVEAHPGRLRFGLDRAALASLRDKLREVEG